MLKVEKRNGNVVDFEQDKIKIAIEKAMKETEKGVDEEVSSKIASEVFEEVKDKDLVNIEDIQDLVELALMKYRPEVAKKYILYRQERTKLREKGWDMSALQRDIYEKKYRYDSETFNDFLTSCLLYTSPSPRDVEESRMPSSA